MNTKFNELEYVNELKNYVENTYSQHYAVDGKIQYFDYLVQKDKSRALYFALDNCGKYLHRQGDKIGQERKDIMKIIHYGMLALYCYDSIENENKKAPSEHGYDKIDFSKDTPVKARPFLDTTSMPQDPNDTCSVKRPDINDYFSVDDNGVVTLRATDLIIDLSGFHIVANN